MHTKRNKGADEKKVRIGAFIPDAMDTALRTIMTLDQKSFAEILEQSLELYIEGKRSQYKKNKRNYSTIFEEIETTKKLKALHRGDKTQAGGKSQND